MSNFDASSRFKLRANVHPADSEKRPVSIAGLTAVQPTYADDIDNPRRSVNKAAPVLTSIPHVTSRELDEVLCIISPQPRRPLSHRLDLDVPHPVLKADPRFEKTWAFSTEVVLEGGLVVDAEKAADGVESDKAAKVAGLGVLGALSSAGGGSPPKSGKMRFLTSFTNLPPGQGWFPSKVRWSFAVFVIVATAPTLCVLGAAAALIGCQASATLSCIAGFGACAIACTAGLSALVHYLENWESRPTAGDFVAA